MKENDNIYVLKLSDGRYSIVSETNSLGKEDQKYLFHLIDWKRLFKGQKLHLKNLEFADLTKTLSCYEGLNQQTNHPIIDFVNQKGLKIKINSMSPCYVHTKLGY